MNACPQAERGDSQHLPYASIWQEFLNGDHISTGSTWGGNGAVLIIPIEDRQILDRIADIQSRLVGLPFRPHPSDLLHITLSAFGQQDLNRIEEMCRYLRKVSSKIAAFELRLRCVNSFFRAPFIELHENEALTEVLKKIEARLATDGFSRLDYGPRGQVLHVTLGSYTQSGDGATVRQALRLLRNTNFGMLPVEKFRLVQTFSDKPYVLETIEDFPLGTENGGRIFGI